LVLAANPGEQAQATNSATAITLGTRCISDILLFTQTKRSSPVAVSLHLRELAELYPHCPGKGLGVRLRQAGKV